MAAVTPEASVRILDVLADYQLVPAPVAESRGGPTFTLTPLEPGGMVARDVVLSSVDSGLVVIATFGVGLFGTSHTPPLDQRIALVSGQQLELARSNSGWVVLMAPTRRDVVAS
ncbi:MAG TPA: hypothetical protein ENK57_00360 [Polyangiaceae bacterium]|nr:hypothetical protein [Polyangiaceae bacterium]